MAKVMYKLNWKGHNRNGYIIPIWMAKLMYKLNWEGLNRNGDIRAH